MLTKRFQNVARPSIKLGQPKLLKTAGPESNFDLKNQPRFIRSDGKMILSTESGVDEFVRWLLPEERSTLLTALKDHEFEIEAKGMILVIHM